MSMKMKMKMNRETCPPRRSRCMSGFLILAELYCAIAFSNRMIFIGPTLQGRTSKQSAGSVFPLPLSNDSLNASIFCGDWKQRLIQNRSIVTVNCAARSIEESLSSTVNSNDRSILNKALLPVAAEYRRVQAIIAQRQRKDAASAASMTRLQQAILCGYVETDSLLAEGLDRFEQLLEQGPVAREQLITCNIGLVYHVVDSVLSSYYHIPQHSQPDKYGRHHSINQKQSRPMNSMNTYTGKRLLYTLTRQDLVQEGTIGLARAIDKYDASYASSTSFSTYAYYWIRAAVLRAIAQKDELVRVPEHVSSAISKIVRAANRLGLATSLDSSQALEHDMLKQYHSFSTNIPINAETRKWEEAQTAKRLADEAGVSLTLLKDALQVQHRRQINGRPLTLEPWMMQNSDTHSSIQHTSHNLLQERSDDMDHLRDAFMPFVNSKEMEALSLRYGLVKPQQPQGFRDYEEEAELELFGHTHTKKNHISVPVPVGGRWGESMSFAEIGKHMQVSAEYGRRLCSSALKKLKQAADDGRLDPALLYI